MNRLMTVMYLTRRRLVVVAVVVAAVLGVAAVSAIAATGPASSPTASSSDPASSSTASSLDPAVTGGSIPGSPSGASAGSAAGSGAVSTQGFPSGPNQAGIFTDRCAHSHDAADDPILAPNQPGAAMHHNFYGNTATSASSTTASLVGGSTTCSTTADASAYWTPVMYQNGVALTPSTALIYWRRPARDSESVQTIPAGLQIIAGNETATAPQSRTVTAWTCTGVLTGVKQATNVPHDCAQGQLRLVVTFPSCWDGHTLTGAGQTNVVYRTASGCPADHPIQIPQIVFHVNYPTSSAANLTLSMTPTMTGSTNTEHVDFMNGWNESILTQDVAACIATQTRCGPVAGASATPKGPVGGNGTKLRAGQGTGAAARAARRAARLAARGAAPSGGSSGGMVMPSSSPTPTT